MSSLSDLIDFLVGLMRDEEANAAFEQNPQGELAGSGLAHVTGQDVRDARMIMRDGGGLHPSGHSGQSGHSGSSHRGGHDDPVREIHHTTTNYRVDEHYQYVDQTFNLIDIDDRDTIVVDSFNSNDNNDTDVIAIQDNSRDTNIEVEDAFNNPSDAPVPTPSESEPAAGIDPVGDEPVGVEEDPVEEDPVVPVEEPEPVPVHEEPDLDPDPVDAAVI